MNAMHSIVRYLPLICCLFGFLHTTAQRIEPGSAHRQVYRDSYFRFHYDNDYFTKTDRYYTQGITLEYAHPALRKNPLNRILLKPDNTLLSYGLSFQLFGFTPTSIDENTILTGDRPFAAAASVASRLTSVDTLHKRRISTTIHLGVLGPAAQGQQIQTGIHRWLRNKIPQGWQFQIRNEPIINYQATIEKAYLTSKTFILQGMAEARIGTLQNRISAGFDWMTGRINDPYSIINLKDFTFYFYGQARADLVGYDASLQGGLFNRSSPYTISGRQISRLVFQADAGLALHFRKLFLTYSQAFITREFRSGVYHRWGGISVGLSI